MSRSNRKRVERHRTPEELRATRRRALRALAGAALLGTAVTGAVAGHRAFQRTHALDLRTIRFEGLSRATATELLALSPARPGDRLTGVDVDAVEEAIARHPWVKSVEVRRSLPPSLVVSVTERRPAALVELSGLYLVDDDGEIFKRARPGDGLDLPLVTGLTRNDWERRRAEAEPLLQGAVALARTWRERGLEAATPISEIHLDPGEGTTLYVGVEGTEVRLGSGDLPRKLSRLQLVLAALGAEGRRAEVLHLENRLHPTRVAVRFLKGGTM